MLVVCFELAINLPTECKSMFLKLRSFSWVWRISFGQRKVTCGNGHVLQYRLCIVQSFMGNEFCKEKSFVSVVGL